MMTYHLTPAAENFFLSDCAEGDHPRRRPRNLPPERAALEKKYGLEPQGEGDAAIAVIGGPDGGVLHGARECRRDRRCSCGVFLLLF